MTLKKMSVAANDIVLNNLVMREKTFKTIPQQPCWVLLNAHFSSAQQSETISVATKWDICRCPWTLSPDRLISRSFPQSSGRGLIFLHQRETETPSCPTSDSKGGLSPAGDGQTDVTTGASRASERSPQTALLASRGLGLAATGVYTHRCLQRLPG